MENREIAAIFFEMADLLDIKGGDRYRVRAFRRIGRVLENLPEPVETMLRFGTLAKVPGIGEGAVARIKEILRTGQTTDQKRLGAALPAGLRDLLKIEGLGPKTVRMIYQELRIGSVDELERAALSGALAKLPRIGEKTQEKLLHAIATFRRNIGRITLEEAIEQGLRLAAAVREEPAALEVQLAGSVRRRKETIGDTDILVAAHDTLPVVARFMTLPEVSEVIAQGESKCSVRLSSGHQVDLRVIPRETFGAGLHYFTGSQQHNIYLRARGNRFGYKISEHGVFAREDDRLLWPGESEEEVFAAVGLPFIPPELRENTGEIEAAAEGRLPVLVTEDDLIGDLHLHTTTGEGEVSAREMAVAALGLGLQYIAITDRAEIDPIEQARRLGRLELELGRLRILSGVEVEILPDGSLGMDAFALRGFDFVVGVIDQARDQGRAEMTARMIRAMESGVIDVLGRPSGRILNLRAPAAFDLEKVILAARRTGVALELCADPRRLDLDPVGCRHAREAGVPIAINSDARAPEEIERRRFGVYTARRGWLERKDVLNARPVREIEQLRFDRLRKSGPITASRPAAPAGALESKEAERRAEADELGRLEQALGGEVLSDELRARLESYLEKGSDDLLEIALRRRDPSGQANPLQTAFMLLHALNPRPS